MYGEIRNTIDIQIDINYDTRMTHRIVFSFDERSLRTLKAIQKQGDFASFADAVRHSLVLARSIQQQEKLGFTELIMRNPKSEVERHLVMPD